jgi:tocopherol O-methyltransferase
MRLPTGADAAGIRVAGPHQSLLEVDPNRTLVGMTPPNPNPDDGAKLGGVPRREDIAAHYDELDDAYLQIWSEHAHHGLWRTGKEPVGEAVQALVEVAADAAGVGLGSQVIDLGSGYGATGRQLADTRGAETTSLTISQRQHDHALIADGDDPRLRQLLRDWFDNGLCDDSYDAVIAIESLGHLDAVPALREALRVLRPGGRIAVCDLIAGDNVPRWQQGLLLRAMERESHLTPLPTIGRLREQFTEAGFIVDETVDLTKGVRNTWPTGIARLITTLRSDKDLRRSLFGGRYENDGFILSLLRMTVGQRIGVVRYYLVSAHKPRD